MQNRAERPYTSTSSDCVIKIMVIVADIKGVFIYHLCFVALSILHHRDKERSTGIGMGRKTKVNSMQLLSLLASHVFQFYSNLADSQYRVADCA